MEAPDPIVVEFVWRDPFELDFMFTTVTFSALSVDDLRLVKMRSSR